MLFFGFHTSDTPFSERPSTNFHECLSSVPKYFNCPATAVLKVWDGIKDEKGLSSCAPPILLCMRFQSIIGGGFNLVVGQLHSPAHNFLNASCTTGHQSYHRKRTPSLHRPLKRSLTTEFAPPFTPPFASLSKWSPIAFRKRADHCPETPTFRMASQCSGHPHFT